MSQYFIDRIEAIDNIEVLTQTETVALHGSPEKQLERVRWRNNVTGEQTEKPIRHVFCSLARIRQRPGSRTMGRA
jgi:thioredoxin reductase (NADPH)